MYEKRVCLKPGTRIQLEGGGLYEIIGDPIGSGGGSILYPAHRLFLYAGELTPDGIVYALKECYPTSPELHFVRDAQGEVRPQHPGEAECFYLERVKQMQLSERQVTQKIYQTGSRLLPIREAAERIVLTLPEKVPVQIENTITVMESLVSKGQSLETYLRQYRRMTCIQTFHIIQQVLFALREIHQSGYLHLDLQPSNIFLRGTLEDESATVTMIDFGSARPLVGRKTDVIHDRVIFTTWGFSAPEILLHNDGTLQLGPEADLYSVGCLMLCLLTGNKYDPNELQRNTTGNYLSRFKLRKIDCPKHLVSRLQAIIAHALEKDPEKRYHSTDEMLGDVTDFLNALRPYRSDLSAVSYDAFLCYRHGPVDSAAAKLLQQKLEHFRAAQDISKVRRPFERVFLDEGELSSCADFGAQIREALKNAGWLIVICSPETPKSTWVQLEIDTFLEYHDRSRVLAILTAGEPEESFPPQLRAGKGQQEVLAADARGKDMKAVLNRLKKDTFLRVAAPMMGTSYDSLKQRRKTYVFQRAAAVASVCLGIAVAFSLYTVHQAQIISHQAAQLAQEYENNLISESQYLTTDAKAQLENNDPIGAVERLLAALPSEEQDRPILPEAVYTLSQALGVYTTPLGAEDSMTAVGVFQLPDESKSTFFLDPTGAYLFSADHDSISVWDTERYQILQTYPASDRDEGTYLRCFSEELLMASEPRLIYTTQDLVSCRNYVSGELLWTRVCTGNITNAILSEDDSTVVVLEENRIDLIDVQNGQIRQTIPFEVSDTLYLGTPLVISEDGSKIAFSGGEISEEDAEQVLSTVFLADTTIGTVETLSYDFYDVNDMLFVGNSLAILSTKGYTFRYNNVTSYYTKTLFLWLYNMEERDMDWATSFRYTSPDTCREIAAVHYTDGEKSSAALIAAFANYAKVVDLKSGELLRDYELNAEIVKSYFNDNSFSALTKDGRYYYADFQWDTDRMVSRPYFTDSIDNVQNDSTKHFFYILRYEPDSWSWSDRIIKYEYEKSDHSYETWGTFSGDGYHSFQYLTDRIAYDLSYDGLWLLNCSDSSWKQVISPDIIDYFSLKYGGLSEDQDSLYFYDNGFDEKAVYVVEIASGSYQRYEIPSPVNEAWRLEDVAYWDGKIICLGVAGAVYELPEGPEYISYNKLIIYTWVPGSGSTEILCTYQVKEREQVLYFYDEDRDKYLGPYQCMADAESYVWHSLVVNSKAHTASFLLEDYSESTVTVLSADLSSGKVTGSLLGPFTDSYFNFQTMVQSDSGEQAVLFYYVYDYDEAGSIDFDTKEYKIAVLDGSEQPVYTIPVEFDDSDPYIFFAPDGSSFYICYDSDGVKLRQYNIQTGDLLNELDLSSYCSSVSSLVSSVCFPDDSTALLITSTGSNGVLLDLSGNSPAVLAQIEDCIGYSQETDSFVVGQENYTSDGYTYEIGSFHRYSTEELIQLGRELLGGTQPETGDK